MHAAMPLPPLQAIAHCSHSRRKEMHELMRSRRADLAIMGALIESVRTRTTDPVPDLSPTTVDGEVLHGRPIDGAVNLRRIVYADRDG